LPIPITRASAKGAIMKQVQGRLRHAKTRCQRLDDQIQNLLAVFGSVDDLLMS
jgi:hypothetical protein